MNPETMLEKVCRSLDILVALGATYEGLFPSIIDRSTHQMMTEMPPGIEGQRDGDRSHLGSNLIHDQAVLKTMYALAEALDRPDYAQAADRYLQRFATHCTDTITGIFPWGEHAYWHLLGDRVADSYQLREEQAPARRHTITCGRHRSGCGKNCMPSIRHASSALPRESTDIGPKESHWNTFGMHT